MTVCAMDAEVREILATVQPQERKLALSRAGDDLVAVTISNAVWHCLCHSRGAQSLRRSDGASDT